MKFLYGKAKIEALEKMPNGTKVGVTGVMGGSTYKNGEPFEKGCNTFLPVKYFDMDMGKGVEYSENTEFIIVKSV